MEKEPLGASDTPNVPTLHRSDDGQFSLPVNKVYVNKLSNYEM
jgi:hypothetical protein